jgi:hypothetical protein
MVVMVFLIMDEVDRSETERLEDGIRRVRIMEVFPLVGCLLALKKNTPPLRSAESGNAGGASEMVRTSAEPQE